MRRSCPSPTTNGFPHADLNIRARCRTRSMRTGGTSLVDKSLAFHKARRKGSHVSLFSGSRVPSASPPSLHLRASVNNPLSSVFNCPGNNLPDEKNFFFSFFLSFEPLLHGSCSPSRVHPAPSTCSCTLACVICYVGSVISADRGGSGSYWPAWR